MWNLFLNTKNKQNKFIDDNGKEIDKVEIITLLHIFINYRVDQNYKYNDHLPTNPNDINNKHIIDNNFYRSTETGETDQYKINTQNMKYIYEGHSNIFIYYILFLN